MNDKKLIIYAVIAILIVFIFLYITKKHNIDKPELQQQNFNSGSPLHLEPYGDNEYNNMQETETGVEV